MRRAMISQPVTDRSQEQAAEDYARAVSCLVKLGYTVMDSTYADLWTGGDDLRAQGVRNVSLTYAGRRIQRMAQCDAVFFARGWHDSRDCRLDHFAAQAYGLDVLYE